MAVPPGRPATHSGELCCVEGCADLVVGRVGAADANVVGDRGVEDVRLLGQHPDVLAEVVAIGVAQLHSGEPDRPAVRQEAHQHVGERRLARAARADHRHALCG